MPQIQHITAQLDGITAGDYLAHLLDPDPAPGTSRLRSVSVDAPDPLGDTIVATLRWDGRAPSPRAAAAAAGFTLTGDVTRISSRVEVPLRRRRRPGAPVALRAAA